MPAATLLSAALLAAALVAGVLLTDGLPEAAADSGARSGAAAVAAPALSILVTSPEPCSPMAFVFLAGLRSASGAVAASPASPAGIDARIHPCRLVFGPKPLPLEPRPLDALFTIPGLAILRR
jgi:hypothetical protein